MVMSLLSRLIVGFVLRLGANRVIDWVRGYFDRRNARAILAGDRPPHNFDLTSIVKRELSGLSKGPITKHLNKFGFRNWISDPVAQGYFAVLLNNRLAGNPPEIGPSLKISELYETHTGENRLLALGHAAAIVNYLKARIVGLKRRNGSELIEL